MKEVELSDKDLEQVVAGKAQANAAGKLALTKLTTPLPRARGPLIRK